MFIKIERQLKIGTGKSGRYLNTKGSGRTVSDFALVHSYEGTFRLSQKKAVGEKTRLRLESGGHGQKNIDLLKKYGISYNITKTFSNGVRIGNIPNHKNKKKRTGSSQSWFPKNWTKQDIKLAGQHIANLKSNRKIPDGKAVYGNWKGVRVGIIKTHGKIATIFPDIQQPSLIKRKKGKK